jgi:hypothetical protein
MAFLLNPGSSLEPDLHDYNQRWLGVDACRSRLDRWNYG